MTVYIFQHYIFIIFSLVVHVYLDNWHKNVNAVGLESSGETDLIKIQQKNGLLNAKQPFLCFQKVIIPPLGLVNNYINKGFPSCQILKKTCAE